MAHAFDTGAAAPQRTRIRQGAVSILAGLRRPTGYLVEVMPIEQVVRSWRDDIGCAILYATLIRFPSIAVCVADRLSEVKGIGGYQERGEIDLFLYHASNNARVGVVGRQAIDSAGTANDHADPGLDVIMDHAKELLIGQRLDSGLDIKQVRPDHEEQLYSAAPVQIWLQAFKVTVNVQISQFRTANQLLESIRFRLTSKPTEAHLPAAATSPTTIDVNVDDLA